MGNSNNNNNIHNSTPLAPQAPETPEPDPARLSIDLEMSIAFANESRTPEDLFNSFYGATTTSSTAAQQASDPAASMPPITQSYVDVDADDDDLDEPEVALERTDEDIQVSLSQQSQEVCMYAASATYMYTFYIARTYDCPHARTRLIAGYHTNTIIPHYSARFVCVGSREGQRPG